MINFNKIAQQSLMSTTLISLVYLPAQAEIIPLQTGSQGATISGGNNNQIIQVINQTIINRPGRGQINRFENKKNKGRGHGIDSSDRDFQERGNSRRNHDDDDRDD